MSQRNFLPDQYLKDAKLEINHNYLKEQFQDYDIILNKIREVVRRGDFTLGSEVDCLEEEFSRIAGTKHAIAVGSGTDALLLSLKAVGIGEGDEVITTPYTFFATVGAIVTSGANPVFVDIGLDYNIDCEKIERAITTRTKAILPVHWAGRVCDMGKIKGIADQHNLYVVEDACHAVQASYSGLPAGSLGDVGCFSFHPLKNLNVWGDGGIATTNSDEIASKLRLLRNHGLLDRNLCSVFAYNSRLDTIQAVIARHLLPKLAHITESRISNAKYFDSVLTEIPEILVPPRDPKYKEVFHLYVIRCAYRDELRSHLIKNGVDAKIHYPIPMHLQPAASSFGYKNGDFPVCEQIVKEVLSLPVHEFISHEQRNSVVNLIFEFYQSVRQ